MKKKYSVPPKDKKAWIDFTNKIGDVFPKDNEVFNKNNKIKKLDLHGYSLVEANKVVQKFIIKSFENGYKKLIVITGKGTRSKSLNNPYLSRKYSILKHSIPEFIQNDEVLNNKISKISQANLKDGGEGAIYIFLNNNKEFKGLILISRYL